MSAFYDAFWWLQNHPAFAEKGRMTKKLSQEAYGHPYKESGFDQALHINVVKVDPTTLRIEDDETRNTQVRIWIEVTVYLDPDVKDGPYGYNGEQWENDIWMEHSGIPSHDYELDVGGATFEEAIIKLAAKVAEQYGE